MSKSASITNSTQLEVSEGSSDDEKGNVPLGKIERVLFDGKDFPTWKFRFDAVLRGYGLLDIVDGTADVNAKGYSKRRDHVYSMLVMSLTDTTVKFAMNAKRGDAAAVWLNLHTEYERNTRYNKISLRRQLYQLCGNKTLGIVELVAKIDLLSTRLESLKVTITDEEKLAVLLSGANGECEAVVACLELADENSAISYSMAVEKLKDFHGRSKQKNGGDPDKLVLAVKKDVKEIVCFECKQKGHYANRCPEKLKVIKLVKRENNSW
jgi:hypothetical protein